MSETATTPATEPTTDSLNVRVAKALGWTLQKVPVSNEWRVVKPLGGICGTVIGDSEEEAWMSADIIYLPISDCSLGKALEGPVAFLTKCGVSVDINIRHGKCTVRIDGGISRSVDSIDPADIARTICEAFLAAVDCIDAENAQEGGE